MFFVWNTRDNRELCVVYKLLLLYNHYKTGINLGEFCWPEEAKLKSPLRMFTALIVLFLGDTRSCNIPRSVYRKWKVLDRIVSLFASFYVKLAVEMNFCFGILYMFNGWIHWFFVILFTSGIYRFRSSNDSESDRIAWIEIEGNRCPMYLEYEGWNSISKPSAP